MPHLRKFEPQEEILTVSDAANFLRCHKSTIYRIIRKSGFDGAFKVGSDWRLLKASLINYLIAQGHEPPLPKKERGST